MESAQHKDISIGEAALANHCISPILLELVKLLCCTVLTKGNIFNTHKK
jgi:hypothetical protein